MLPCPKVVRGQLQLTPEQEAYAREFARERIAAMLSITPIDEQVAETHLREAYRVFGLRPPARIRWFDSPLSFLWTRVEEKNVEGGMEALMWAGGRVNVEANVWQSVRVNVQANVRSNVWQRVVSIGRQFPWMETGPPLWMDALRSVEEGLVARAWEKVKERVGADVWQSVTANMGENAYTLWLIGVMTSGGESVRELVTALRESSMSLGQLDILRAYQRADHFAFHWFFHEAFEENALIHLARFNELVSGYWLGDKEVWLIRKPVLLQRDEQGRFHSANGPCVQYRDGWGWYAWHGVHVPEKLILSPEQVTREEWVQERNVEVRRAIQERLGSERFIQLVGGVCIHKNRRGKLIQIKLSVRDPDLVAHYVQVQDSSTSRHYYLRVPPWINSVDEAIAWTFGLSARDYRPGQET